MRQWVVSASRQKILNTSSWNHLRCRRTFSALAQKPLPSENRSTNSTHVPPIHVETTSSQIDPFSLVSHDLLRIQSNLLDLMGSAHPDLREMAEYYFLSPARQLRPVVVLLMSRASNGLAGSWKVKRWAADSEYQHGRSEEFDRPLTQPGVLESWNSTMPNDRFSFENLFELRQPEAQPTSLSSHSLASRPSAFSPSVTLLPTQMRLAQIVEMINIASILHDGISELSSAKNTKLSILGGDFLLGRASSALSRLGEAEVIELVASVISNLAEGEILQIPNVRMPVSGQVAFPTTWEDAWNVYLKRTYMKTASLIAKGARSATILGGSTGGEILKDAAYCYGRHLGTAYQLVEDILELDNILSPEQFRLPTGPVLFAWKASPRLGNVLHRRLSEPGDVDLVKSHIVQSSAVEKAKALAYAHASRARSALKFLPESSEKSALENLTHLVVERTW